MGTVSNRGLMERPIRGSIVEEKLGDTAYMSKGMVARPTMVCG